MFHVQPNVTGGEEQYVDGEPEEVPQIVAPGLGDDRPRQVQYTSPTLDEDVPAQRTQRGTLGGGASASAGRDDPKFADVARNAPCPCGSGKKFKRCHGDPKNAA
jgi:preprotein translocase subunit SecA